ncbi:MAG: hypothetical protein HY541_01950 [Deltaproteobacteria bacterium]|nr:hypothetical protein [Deltaproteobacteria bacterium]
MKKLLLGTLLVFLSACFSRIDLKGHTLPTALLNEYYTYSFELHAGWADFWDSSMSTQWYGGVLPSGIGIASNGLLFGTPQEPGDFEFRVLAQDDDFFDDESWSDAEWFTLFVTEPSTNEDCPQPDDETTEGIYLCLGDVGEESLNTGDSFSLDGGYFVNLDNGGRYDILTLSFTITYDSASFAVDAETLTSSLLREAASRAHASVSYNTETAGQLGVTITTTDKPFIRAGRIIDIPFTALLDLNQEEYSFTLTIDAVTPQHDETELPEIIAVDGTLTIDEPAGDETG